MQGDVLSGGVPKRLIHEGGVWALEIVRQVAVERSVYRPVKQRLEGADVIMRYFKRSPQLKNLGMAALQLLQSPPTDQTRSFDAVNGEWVPSVIAPSYVDELKRQHARNSQRSAQVQLLEVRTECIRLRHANTSLIGRMSELEKKMEWLATELEVVRNQRPVIVQAAVAPVEVAAPTSVQEEVPVAAPSNFQPIELPGSDDLVRCIEQLIGSDVSAKQVPTPARLPDAKDSYYIAILTDDNDTEVGAIYMDLKAAVYLGGNLLMVPESELISQVRAKRPSEDSVAASSEVCNALSGSINNVPGNPHVRTTFLALLVPDAIPWAKSPRAVLALEDTLGGKVLLASR